MDWDVDLYRKDSYNFQERKQLAGSILSEEFAPEIYEMLKKSIYSGLFFDCLFKSLERRNKS